MSDTTDTYTDGVLVSSAPAPPRPAESVHADTLRERAQQALVTNRTFLALASPTNAQTLAQVRHLTRVTQGLLRFELADFDGTV